MCVLKVLRLALNQYGVGLIRLPYRLVGKVKGNINDRICTVDLKILAYPNTSICLAKCLCKKRNTLSKAHLERTVCAEIEKKVLQCILRLVTISIRARPRSLF